MRQTWCAILLPAIFCAAVRAQPDTASVTGLVTDGTGGVLPGVTVTAGNVATNISVRGLTDDNGFYTLGPLKVGEYTLSAEMIGFKKEIRTGIILEVGQKPRIDFELQIGEMTEHVMVEARTPLLQTQAAAPGSVIDNNQITHLPLSQRNWDDLLNLVAGVHGDRYTEESGATSAGRTGGVNVHGVRSLQNNFVLDGVDNNSISTNVQELTTQVVRPSIDSIQEFRVTTSPYAAENGRSPGALISVVTRSGSNSFRGTLYEYMRNRVFDANNFFANRSAVKKGANVQNQFGGNMGGPIAKNRAFFFVDYEGTRIRKGVNRLATVPLPSEKAGDFSAGAAAAARAAYATLVDPLTRQPFPNHKVPADRFDPVARRLMDLFPNPNLTPSSGPLNRNNFFRIPTVEDDVDRMSVRVDFHATPNDDLVFRYSFSDRFRFIPGFFGGIADGTSTSAWGRQFIKGHSAAIGWTRIIGARAVNEFRLGWGRNDSQAVQDPFGKNTLAEFGIKGVPDSPIYSGGVPGTNLDARGGVPGARLGSPDFLPKFQKTNQFQWSDTLHISYRAHRLRAGADVRAPLRNIYLDIPAMRGQWRSSGQFTGNSYADFLLGYVSQAQLSNLAIVDLRLHMYSFFIQDDWKVTPDLTLNLGLRYDFSSGPFEGADRMANLDLRTGQLIHARSGSLRDRTLVKTDRNNFAPRFGLAYEFAPLTVLRLGYGRFFMLFERAGSEDQLGLNPPYLINNSVQLAGAERAKPLFLVGDGFPAAFLDPARLDLTRIRLRAVHPDSVTPAVDQWNVGVQRELPNEMVVTVDYVGTKGTHLSVLRNLNQVFFGTTVRPYPQLGVVEFRENTVNSNYHALEATVEKRFSQGYSLRGAYTLSKSIDYAQEHLFGGGSSSFMQDSRNLKAQRGLSDFDSMHRFVFNTVYEVPLGPGHSLASDGWLARVLGGWRISGVFGRRSGRPFTVFAGANNAFVGAFASALPDRVGEGALPKSQRSVDQWFDVSAFVVPSPPRPGNAGRNILGGPGLTNLDLAVGRVFSLGYDGRLEFRWEVFNVTNTPQFGLPERNRSSSAAGTITTLAGDPRVMQFALRILF